MKIDISLKERHLCYLTSLVINSSASGFFDFLTEVRTKLKAVSYTPTQLVPVSVGHDDLIVLYRLMVDKRESDVAVMNSDIRSTLTPQLDAIIAGAGPQAPGAQAVKTVITTATSDSTASLTNTVQIARAWLTR